MKSIYVDSFLLHSNTSDLGAVVQSPVEGLDMSSIRLANYDKIGEFGSYVSNHLYGGRLITLNGFIYATNITAFNQKRRAVENAIQINKDNNSVPIPHVLSFTTMDNLALQCNVYLKAFTMKMTNLTNAIFQIQFYCPD